MFRAVLSIATLGAALTIVTAAVAETPEIAAGRRLAERNCGGCHAVGAGASPHEAAPPFRDLHHRYPPGGLPQILQEGMIAPIDTQEEGSVPVHPRMPQVELGPDEVFELIAYLRSLEPQAGRAR